MTTKATATSAQQERVTPVPVPVTVPYGYWQREASHYPQPLSPLSRTTFVPQINQSFRTIFEESGSFLEAIDFREIGGWVYNRQVPLGGKDRRALPPFAMKLALKFVPSLRARLRKNLQAIRDDVLWEAVGKWPAWRAEQAAQLAAFRAVDMAALNDGAFTEHFRAVTAFVEQGVDRHFRLTPPGLVVAELVFACQELLGWDQRKPFALLTGTSTTSTEPSRKLAELARMATTRPAVRAALDSADESTAGRLASIDAEFAGTFDAYQQEFGFRALRYDAADPALIEVPHVTLGLIRDQLRRGYDPVTEAEGADRRRQDALVEARAALAGRTAAERARFERTLERATTYYPIREDNEFYTVSAPLAVIRFAALELGRRLVEGGRLAVATDIFFLELGEADRALESGDEFRELVERRRGERAWVLAHPGPPSYGKNPGPPPDPSVFPGEAATMLRATLWSIESVFASEASQAQQADRTRITGIGAAPGSYTGPVRVIMGEGEFDKIEAGDVLVCPITSPVWSVLFPSVGALVTDTGGALSHPAIISREYGIPAVVATGNATALLKDGQIVTVDGGAGTVVTA
jgi:phosphohistidine swiveling domain-containing protein